MEESSSSHQNDEINQANGSRSSSPAPPPIVGMADVAFPLNLAEEVPMNLLTEDREMELVQNQKSVIMHIISQLREGKDLTKVVLPAFILERRSLLEMFADYNAHPQFFIDITTGASPHERMKKFVKWFLTTFHACKKDRVARKPYNPIIGEIFRCSWRLPSSQDPQDAILITFCGEQVSHHPPITAFHIDCSPKRMQLVGSIHTQSRFRGLSIYVNMVGKVTLTLGEHDEDYVFTLPTAYGRSILTVPWFELGGTVSVECPQSGYSAVIEFYKKSLQAKRLHQVSAEIFAKNSSETPKKAVVTVTGHWNSTMEFVDHVMGTTEVVDTAKLEVEPKWVRPLAFQAPNESQKLWASVSAALEVGDLDLATEEKTKLEEIQRVSEQARAARDLPHTPKYFKETPNGYVFLDILESGIKCPA